MRPTRVPQTPWECEMTHSCCISFLFVVWGDDPLGVRRAHPLECKGDSTVEGEHSGPWVPFRLSAQSLRPTWTHTPFSSNKHEGGERWWVLIKGTPLPAVSSHSPRPRKGSSKPTTQIPSDLTRVTCPIMIGQRVPDRPADT